MGPYTPSGNPVSLYNPNVTPRSSLALDPLGLGFRGLGVMGLGV